MALGLAVREGHADQAQGEGHVSPLQPAHATAHLLKHLHVGGRAQEGTSSSADAITTDVRLYRPLAHLARPPLLLPWVQVIEAPLRASNQ